MVEIVVSKMKLIVLGEYEIVGWTAGITESEIVVVALPVAFVADTVYVDTAVSDVGVPVITPVEVLMEMPAGKDGETDQEATVPPVLVGLSVGMATLVARESKLGEYEIAGSARLQTILTDVENPFALRVNVSVPAALPM